MSTKTTLCNLRSLLASLLLLCGLPLAAETYFVEAEAFEASEGWKPAPNRLASKLTALHGALGDPNATAVTELEIAEAGLYRIWVRYSYWHRWRGPFRLTAIKDGERVGEKVFDAEAREDGRRHEFVWDSFDCELPAGPVTLELSKATAGNVSGYTRYVDCVMLTTDLEKKPDHLEFGTQTYLRVTLGERYTEPVYIHIFSDHYRAPWYGHHNLSKEGFRDGLHAPAQAKLLGGEQTPWCNITTMLYQDSGAILNFTIRQTYHKREEALHATFEFATAPDDGAIVRTMHVVSEPNGLVVVCPPDLATEENLGRLKRDKDFAEEIGRIADSTAWPTIGKKPDAFPFFVSASLGGYGTPVDQAITDRELKTLSYFGFSNWSKTILGGGTWQMLEGSYCRPNMERITAAAQTRAKELAEAGKGPQDVTYSMVMDEPTGQPLAFMAADEAYGEAFRSWLQELGMTSETLLVASWDAVRPVTAEEREQWPALYYFSQRFRTKALGDFIAVQRRTLEEATGGSFPVLVNFSDGATYHGNFYTQGVDYFTLLRDESQNAIWGEDWANGAASYQCGAYNVDLMRAAAREHGQVIGHYLIAHAGRLPLDVKLKAAGNVARGVKILKSFSYGVYWGTHEGGPAWRSHTWQAKPATWVPYAEITHEIGGAEDLLLPAMPQAARVAILYASSSDVWQSGHNLAYGFNRMFTWMALAHAQVPVDFVSEEQVAAGLLDGYDVCYVSGPNLTRDAAQKLADWTTLGGSLVITADGASRDEYNRPLETVTQLLPASRGEVTTHQGFQASGRYLNTLRGYGTVNAGAATFKVLSVSQALEAKEGATVIGRFDDGSAAWIRGASGEGTVDAVGFLPALDYMHVALVARQALQDADPASLTALEQAKAAILKRSYNPWEYPAAQREALLQPVRAAKVDPPIHCNVPLVDAVYMVSSRGVVIPLANYTLNPLASVTLSVRLDRTPTRVESVHQGALAYVQDGDRITIALPLASTDYVKIYFDEADPADRP